MDYFGKYFDGQKPISLNVICKIENNLLIIVNASDFSNVETWEIANIIRDEDTLTSFIYKTSKGQSYIELNQVPQELVSKTTSHLNIEKNVHAIIAYLLGLILIMSVLYFGMESLINFITTRVSRETETKIFNSFSDSITSNHQVCVPQAGSRLALQKLIDRINPEGQQNGLKFDVEVLGADIKNAFALPGGKIFIMRALLPELNNAEELAGILSHEIAHVERRHSLNALVKGLGLAYAIHLINGDFSSAFAINPSTAIGLTQLKYSRLMEKEADELAIERLIRSEIDTKHLAAFFSRLSRQSKINYSFLSTHPADKERSSYILQKSKKQSRPILSIDEWRDLKAYCK
jgi:Zn-dependent protease with chaperone function